MNLTIKTTDAISGVGAKILLGTTTSLAAIAEQLAPVEQAHFNSLSGKGISTLEFYRENGPLIVHLTKYQESDHISIEKCRREGFDFLDRLKKLQIRAVGIQSFCPWPNTLGFVEGMALGSY
ncbi:MAG: hypothetical protein AAFV80_05035, partial [Bacteroidota bacterium]